MVIGTWKNINAIIKSIDLVLNYDEYNSPVTILSRNNSDIFYYSILTYSEVQVERIVYLSDCYYLIWTIFFHYDAYCWVPKHARRLIVLILIAFYYT